MPQDVMGVGVCGGSSGTALSIISPGTELAFTCELQVTIKAIASSTPLASLRNPLSLLPFMLFPLVLLY
jgi:hypothetical protein